MPRDHFLFRKKHQLQKDDKSLKQIWDKKISGLCEKINKSNNYYTTSSCSGRAVILINSKEKRDDLFIKIWHDKLNFEEINQVLENIKYSEMIYFKQEPCILHVSCRTLKDAQKIHDIAKSAGWKRCGIIATKKRIMVELNSTEHLEFPIFNKGSILITDEFLSEIINETNRKLEDSWEKISKMEKLML